MENKFQEALDYVKDVDVYDSGVSSIFDAISYEFNIDGKEVLSTLQELVDREAPKKPILKKDVDLGIDYDDIYVCPECEQIVSDLIKPEYCSKCGQHLDWKDRKVK